jgi:hypothetical protein
VKILGDCREVLTQRIIPEDEDKRNENERKRQHEKYVKKKEGKTKENVSQNEGEENDENPVNVKSANNAFKLRFMDILKFIPPMSLRRFVACFGVDVKNTKAFFPYESFTMATIHDVLGKTEPFAKADFYSKLTKSGISDDEYKQYLEDYNDKIAKGVIKNRWGYLLYYNELDTIIMINPINNLINLYWDEGVDILMNYSLAACANVIKYVYNLKGFEFSPEESKNANTTQQPSQPFCLSREFYLKMIEGYKRQDKAAKRDVAHNLCENDHKTVTKMISDQGCCCFCSKPFSWLNKPTLDRINNDLPHTLSNVRACCLFCNRAKSNNDEMMFKFQVQIRRYADTNCLPKSIPCAYQDTYKILREGNTGGLSIAQHRYNKHNVTRINKMYYSVKHDRIKSIDTKNVMTHVIGFDFSSLYPSVVSSNVHPFIPYTGHRYLMPGEITSYMEVKTDDQMKRAKAIIHSKRRFDADYNELFVAEVKGYIPREHLYKYIDFPPIIRRVKVKHTEEVIGEFMSHLYKPTDVSEKLTYLLNTATPGSQELTFMTFSSYYLWTLIDDFNFVVTDIKSVITFNAKDQFGGFINTLFGKRVKAIEENNNPKNNFYKMILNSSYGYDALNEEKHKIQRNICGEKKCLQMQCRNNFLGTVMLKADDYNPIYCVHTTKTKFSCKTCLHEALFTLDNSKAWYLTFAYKFLFKCIDPARFHFNHADTDSLYISVSGYPYVTEEEMMMIHDPSVSEEKRKYLRDVYKIQSQRYKSMMKPYEPDNDSDKIVKKVDALMRESMEKEFVLLHDGRCESMDEFDRSVTAKQGIDAIIVNKPFYNKWKGLFLPKDKTLLTVTVEHLADSEFSVSPKCYSLESIESGDVYKSKGFTMKQTEISMEDYENCIKDPSQEVRRDTMHILVKNNQVTKHLVRKIALSPKNDKGVSQNDQSFSVIPFYSGCVDDTSIFKFDRSTIPEDKDVCIPVWFK